jgi:hypothetical protein
MDSDEAITLFVVGILIGAGPADRELKTSQQFSHRQLVLAINNLGENAIG